MLLAGDVCHLAILDPILDHLQPPLSSSRHKISELFTVKTCLTDHPASSPVLISHKKNAPCVTLGVEEVPVGQNSLEWVPNYDHCSASEGGDVPLGMEDIR